MKCLTPKNFTKFYITLDKWRARLKACVRADSGYFEHML